MKIVSTTLSGNARDTIGDALRSVKDQVDQCLVIDTGITDDTLEVAAEAANGKLAIRHFPWTGSFAEARNYAMAAATDMRADWAVTVDTDERLLFDEDFDLHERLAESPKGLVLVQQADKSYFKERCFKLPTTLNWRGPSHEMLEGSPEGVKLRGMMFTELAKDEKQLIVKFTRDRDALRAYTEAHPEEPRWWYFLGASYHGLGEYHRAIDAYTQCADLSTWPEEGAWSCFSAAVCCIQLKQFAQGIKHCARGLMIRPATAELAWVAAICSHNLKRLEDTLAWANMAIANGGDKFPRLSFCDPQGLHEGPYQMLYLAHTELGNEKEAKEAERMWWEARARR